MQRVTVAILFVLGTLFWEVAMPKPCRAVVASRWRFALDDASARFPNLVQPVLHPVSRLPSNTCHTLILFAAAGLVPSTTAKADCSPSLGEYATLANFTILAELLDATSLYGMLMDVRGSTVMTNIPSPSTGALNNTAFTAFAPTDMAFMNALELLDIPAERLVAPDVIDTLTGLLSFHVALAPWSPAVRSMCTTYLLSVINSPLTEPDEPCVHQRVDRCRPAVHGQVQLHGQAVAPVHRCW